MRFSKRQPVTLKETRDIDRLFDFSWNEGKSNGAGCGKAEGLFLDYAPSFECFLE